MSKKVKPKKINLSKDRWLFKKSFDLKDFHKSELRRSTQGIKTVAKLFGNLIEIETVNGERYITDADRTSILDVIESLSTQSYDLIEKI